jgi:hypothetical protein
MSLPNHLFVSSSDGALYDTRKDNWSLNPPLRANYNRGHNRIETVADLKATLRAGRYTDLGGYPLFFITNDGAALSFDAVTENLRTVMDSVANDIRDGWKVVAVDINYEDTELTCDHTGKKIPSAYGEDEEQGE